MAHFQMAHVTGNNQAILVVRTGDEHEKIFGGELRKEFTLKIPENITKTQFIKDFEKWSKEGAMIQNALPYLSNDEREFLMTGITPEEWDKMFGKEPE